MILDHGGGLGTVYAHQSTVGVGQGQSVRKVSDVVGYVGQTPAWRPGPTCTSRSASTVLTYDPLNFVRPP